MKNKYPGKCIHCGLWIQAGDGELIRSAEGRWAVKHGVDCTSTNVVEVKCSRCKEVIKPAKGVPDGFGGYRCEDADGCEERSMQTKLDFDDPFADE